MISVDLKKKYLLCTVVPISAIFALISLFNALALAGDKELRVVFDSFLGANRTQYLNISILSTLVVAQVVLLIISTLYHPKLQNKEHTQPALRTFFYLIPIVLSMIFVIGIIIASMRFFNAPSSISSYGEKLLLTCEIFAMILFIPSIIILTSLTNTFDGVAKNVSATEAINSECSPLSSACSSASPAGSPPPPYYGIPMNENGANNLFLRHKPRVTPPSVISAGYREWMPKKSSIPTLMPISGIPSTQSSLLRRRMLSGDSTTSENIYPSDFVSNNLNLSRDRISSAPQLAIADHHTELMIENSNIPTIEPTDQTPSTSNSLSGRRRMLSNDSISLEDDSFDGLTLDDTEVNDDVFNESVTLKVQFYQEDNSTKTTGQSDILQIKSDPAIEHGHQTLHTKLITTKDHETGISSEPAPTDVCKDFNVQLCKEPNVYVPIEKPLAQLHASQTKNSLTSNGSPLLQADDDFDVNLRKTHDTLNIDKKLEIKSLDDQKSNVLQFGVNFQVQDLELFDRHKTSIPSKTEPSYFLGTSDVGANIPIYSAKQESNKSNDSFSKIELAPSTLNIYPPYKDFSCAFYDRSQDSTPKMKISSDVVSTFSSRRRNKTSRTLWHDNKYEQTTDSIDTGDNIDINRSYCYSKCNPIDIFVNKKKTSLSIRSAQQVIRQQ